MIAQRLVGRSIEVKLISDSSSASFPPNLELEIIVIESLFSSNFLKSGSSKMALPNPEEITTADFVFFKFQFSFFVLSLIEFPMTITSEKAIANAAIIGFKKPIAAIGIAITL